MSKWDDWGPVAVVIGTVATVGALQWKSASPMRARRREEPKVALRDNVNRARTLREKSMAWSRAFTRWISESRWSRQDSAATQRARNITVRELVDMRFEAEQAEQDKLVQAAEANE